MAFANNYVVSVLVNDKPQREISVNGKRSIQLPFDTEYKIRLKNQTNLRALVNVCIDGAPVFMGGKQLILNPKQSIDLERFVSDLDSGHRFKFMKQDRLGDNGHFDPTTSDLGKLSVEFVPELQLRLGFGTLATLQPYPPYNPFVLDGGVKWFTNPHIYSCSTNAQSSHTAAMAYDSVGVAGARGNSGDKGIVSTNSCSEVSLGAMANCSLGGTVEGGVSTQEFQENTSAIMWEYSKRTTIDIHMAGPSPKVEMTKSEVLAKQFYNEFGGNYDCAPRDIQKALAYVVEKTILHTVLNK